MGTGWKQLLGMGTEGVMGRDLLRCFHIPTSVGVKEASNEFDDLYIPTAFNVYRLILETSYYITIHNTSLLRHNGLL